MNRERARRGVLVCFNDNGDGSLNLSLDDIVKDAANAQKWTLDEFVTSKNYEEETLRNLDFNDKELADFGYAIISRLYAFYKQNEI